MAICFLPVINHESNEKCFKGLKNDFTQLSEKISTVAKETFATLSTFVNNLGNALLGRAKTIGWGSGLLVAFSAIIVIAALCTGWPALITGVLCAIICLVCGMMTCQAEKERLVSEQK